MKCPYCGSKNTQGTNLGQRAFADIVAFGAGLLGSIAGPSASRAALVTTNRNICQYREYICLDCKETFRESR